MPVLDARAVECRVSVFREGLLTSLGHDVDLRVTEFVVDIDEGGESVTADFVARSLRVCDDAEGVSAVDRRDIERNAARALDVRRYPLIAFRSTRVLREGSEARIDGRLTLHGVTKDITVPANRDGQWWRADVSLDQRDFGITPFSAMFGALKIKPGVVVHIAVRPA